MRHIFVLLGLAMMFACTSRAQVAISSDGISVYNGSPNVVTFMYPTGPGSNIVMIKFGCSESPLREVFIYEEDQSGHITTYPFTTPAGLPCNEAFGPGPLGPNTAFTGSLQGDVTLTTADHTITIKQSTAWTAAKKSSRTGSYWASTGGSSQITVQ